jgi:hypothetical protein
MVEKTVIGCPCCVEVSPAPKYDDLMQRAVDTTAAIEERTRIAATSNTATRGEALLCSILLPMLAAASGNARAALETVKARRAARDSTAA